MIVKNLKNYIFLKGVRGAKIKSFFNHKHRYLVAWSWGNHSQNFLKKNKKNFFKNRLAMI